MSPTPTVTLSPSNPHPPSATGCAAIFILSVFFASKFRSSCCETRLIYFMPYQPASFNIWLAGSDTTSPPRLYIFLSVTTPLHDLMVALSSASLTPPNHMISTSLIPLPIVLTDLSTFQEALTSVIERTWLTGKLFTSIVGPAIATKALPPTKSFNCTPALATAARVVSVGN